MNRKKLHESYFGMKKNKHYCRKCGSEVFLKRMYKIVNAKSPEANGFDFSSGTESYLHGDVEFSVQVFCCPSCGSQFRVNEQALYEIEQGWNAKGVDNPKQLERNKMFFSWAVYLFAYLFGLLFMWMYYKMYTSKYLMIAAPIVVLLCIIKLLQYRDNVLINSNKNNENEDMQRNTKGN